MRKSQSATQFLREIVTAQTRRQLIILSVFCFFSLNAFPQADLYVGDGTDDNGSQSYVGTNPIYLSPNIWLLKMPDLNYSPYPFPGTAIPWTINAPDALGNQAVLNKGEYRDPSVFYAPNYVYVKVTNTSTTTDYTGGSFLRVFWAKASLALGWPTNWIDFYANPGGGCSTLFLGEEITKPRRDAAFESVSERNKYRDAILDLDQTTYPDGITWWDKQDEIHQNTHTHCGPNFLTWHREFVNRYELLLRNVPTTGNPLTSRYDLIKTHYWDWTTDPRTTTGGRANLFTTDFMGTDQGFVTNPFPANFSTGVTGSGGIERDFQAGAPSAANASSFGFPANTFRLDANLLAAGGGTQATQYQNFRTAEENMHNYIHTYAGGTLGGDFHDAFCDPLAFVLHSEVDRMFARWQRDPAQVNRLVPFDDVTNNDVYGNERNTVGTSLGTCFGGVPMEGIQDFLEPWSTGSGDFGTVAPWDGGSLCQIAKNSTHPSVVSPPIYDTPGVPIPGIPAGQSIIIQIPWHVPNPDYYSCFTGNNKKNIFA